MMRPSKDIPSVYLCINPVDFRKAIGGLSLLVENELELNPFDPALFVFINRLKDKIKILYWEKNGFCLWYKRLEKQRFQWPSHIDASTTTLTSEQLNWLLDGFDLWRNAPHEALYYQSAG